MQTFLVEAYICLLQLRNFAWNVCEWWSFPLWQRNTFKCLMKSCHMPGTCTITVINSVICFFAELFYSYIYLFPVQVCPIYQQQTSCNQSSKSWSSFFANNKAYWNWMECINGYWKTGIGTCIDFVCSIL